jgi:DNA-binding beta-propeller fold protein YncE
MTAYNKLLFSGVAISLILAAMIFVAPLSVSNPLQQALAASGSGSGGSTENRIRFDLTDEPGRWFKNQAGDITGSGTQSLAVGTPGVRVDFGIQSNTVHTVTSLIFPTGAQGMPFDQPRASKSSQSLTLHDPGLYVFTCKVHPYMFGGVIVDDPATQGLDLGENISLVNGITVPTSSDLATRLLRTFFIATTPVNWQDFTSSAPWHVTYPNVDVRITGGAVVNLPAVLNARYGNDITLPALSEPSTPGVGDVWVDTQFEKTSGKTKPGTATRVDATTWDVERKVALPSINMNNPHNMWTDKDQTLIYQTQWFDSKLTVFNAQTGALVKNISVGDAPSHVMTRTDTDQLHVALNGEDVVVEMSPKAQNIQREIPMQRPGEPISGPHAHWMSHDGKKMVTPNAFSADSTLYGFDVNSIQAKPATGAIPIATGMMPDSSKYYVANLLDSMISVIDMKAGSPTFGQVIKTINLIANYDPVSGTITGPVGALPIQTPVSPDGQYMVTANTLTATITIVDTETDSVVKMLGCDAGCHGVQFGAKQGGGYYAYVASKFSNALTVVDGDPNGDGNPLDAAVVGKVSLVATSGTAKDANITGNKGMGGQGVLATPVPYNGWVQNLPAVWKNQLTAQQQNPIGQ